MNDVIAEEPGLRLLLVEDDLETSAYLLKGLRESGHQVEHAKDGDDGLHMAMNGDYEVLILDRMLPKRDGLTLLRILRTDNITTPALIVSALGEVNDRVEGLRAGGDDYLVKPFAFVELLARLEALGRRRGWNESPDVLRVHDLEFDLATRRVTRSGRHISLQSSELKLLEVLMRNSGKLVTRTMLLERVWDIHFDPQSNVVDTQICRLRNKLDKDFDRQLLRTVRGVGYTLAEG